MIFDFSYKYSLTGCWWWRGPSRGVWRGRCRGRGRGLWPGQSPGTRGSRLSDNRKLTMVPPSWCDFKIIDWVHKYKSLVINYSICLIVVGLKLATLPIETFKFLQSVIDLYSFKFLPNKSGFGTLTFWRILTWRKVLHKPALINPLKRNIKLDVLLKQKHSN